MKDFKAQIQEAQSGEKEKEGVGDGGRERYTQKKYPKTPCSLTVEKQR